MRFESSSIWLVESRSLAPMKQTLQGCQAIRRGSFNPKYEPKDLDHWARDIAELELILKRRVLPKLKPKHNQEEGAFPCGISINCGTLRGYNLGGRCSWCRKARSLGRKPTKLVCGEDPRCGSRAGYQSGGRCDKCREARNAYSRVWRKAYVKKFRCKQDGRCGTNSGYQAGGRCPKCRQAHSTHMKDRRKELAKSSESALA